MISGTSRIFKEQNKSILKNGSKGYRKHIHFLSEYNGGFMELSLFYTLDHFRERHCREPFQSKQMWHKTVEEQKTICMNMDQRKERDS